MFFTIRGEVDGFEDASYERPMKGKAGETETVTRFRLSLMVPGTSELVSVDLAPDVAPTTEQQAKWEDARAWVVVTADVMRHTKGESEGRAWSIVSFNAVQLHEMTPKDLSDLQSERREAKKRKKAEAQAKKNAAKAAKQTKAA